jgi:glycosyltransferase involved in cell wall biosynthesis
MTDPSRIQILWLVDHLGFGGSMHGAGKYYLSTIPLIDKSRFDVTLGVLREPDGLTRVFSENSIQVTHLSRNKFDPMTLMDVVRLGRSLEAHLLHVHGYGSSNFGRLGARILGIPAVVHAHDDDRRYPIYQKIADYLLRGFTHRAIAVSQSVKDACVRKRNIPASKVAVLHNGIELQRFACVEPDRIRSERARLHIPPHGKVVGTVGRMREEKGLRYLIQSAPKVLEAFPEANFLIAGDGPLLAELQHLATELKVDRKVIFAGFCRDIPALLSLIDVFTIPSLTEGSPSALLEAMAMGKPIVATQVGGMREILCDGLTGLFVASQDSKSLADKIIYLLSNEEAARNLGCRALAESKKYDISLHASKLEEIYRELLAEKQIHNPPHTQPS